MPLDAICISALAAELQTRIAGGRIDRIQQPERGMLLFSLRANGENLRLLIAAGTGNARVHVTQASFENPAEPPMFCMLLRKHLSGARIVSVFQPEHERMLVITLDSRDELGVDSRKKLIVEMIGRSSNVILAGEDDHIIDCMRRVDFAGDPMRRLLPGMIYRMPPKQNKPVFLQTDERERKALLSAADTEQPIDQWLLDHFSGLSPLICRELAYRSGGDYALLPDQLDALYDSVAAGELAPYMLLREGKPKDFSFLAIRQYGSGSECERFNSFSELLDAFYTRRVVPDDEGRS